MQANAHAEKAARPFKWATIMSEAGRSDHMPLLDAVEICAKIKLKRRSES